MRPERIAPLKDGRPNAYSEAVLLEPDSAYFNNWYPEAFWASGWRYSAFVMKTLRPLNDAEMGQLANALDAIIRAVELTEIVHVPNQCDGCAQAFAQ